MYLDDFLWLPDVVEKLIVKHRVSQDEVEEVFFGDQSTALLRKATGRARMSTPHWDRPMLDGI